MPPAIKSRDVPDVFGDRSTLSRDIGDVFIDETIPFGSKMTWLRVGRGMSLDDVIYEISRIDPWPRWQVSTLIYEVEAHGRDGLPSRVLSAYAHALGVPTSMVQRAADMDRDRS